MNAKVASIAILLLLSWAVVGGCPVNIQADVGIQADTDVDVDVDADGDVNGGSTDGSDGSSADGSPGGGAENGGTGDTTDGGAADGGDASDDGSGGDSTPDDTVPDDGSDGADVPGDDGSQTPFAGTYSGEVTRVKHEAVVQGDWKLEQIWTTPFSVTFDESGLPTAFVVPAYGETEGGIEFVVEINEVGESVTLNESSGGHDVTLTATVLLATYGETSGRVVLSLEHSGQRTIEEEGTGMHVVEYELDGDNLLYSAETNYEVQLAGMVWTYWRVQTDGTLSPE